MSFTKRLFLFLIFGNSLAMASASPLCPLDPVTSRLKVEDLDFLTLERASKDVALVSAKDGSRVYIRHGSQESNTTQDLVLKAMMRLLFGFESAETFFLDSQSTVELNKQIILATKDKDQTSVDLRNMVTRNMRGPWTKQASQPPQQQTVAKGVDGELGLFLLNRQSDGGLINDAILGRLYDHLTRGNLESFRENLDEYAEKANEHQKALFVKQLKYAIPRFSEFAFVSMVAALKMNPYLLSLEALNRLNEKRFASVPQHLQAPLADFWLACTLFGIHDCHAANWVYQQGKVTAIDLAFPAQSSDLQSKNPMALAISFQYAPHSALPLSPSGVNLLIDSGSKDFRQKIKTINQKSIREIAGKLGIQMSDTYFAQILVRLNYLQNLWADEAR